MNDQSLDSGEREPSQEPATRLELSGSVELVDHNNQEVKSEVALLDSALFNLDIAQQYIDESVHLVEQRLISFHYAVALLAKYRNPLNLTMLGRARQYLVDAANWRFAADEHAERLADAHDRIVCEANYNIGVIDELEKQNESANEYYGKAIAIAADRGYSGVEILARLGRISTAIKGMRVEINEEDARTAGRNKSLSDIVRLKSRIISEAAGEEGKAPAARAFSIAATKRKDEVLSSWKRAAERLFQAKSRATESTVEAITSSRSEPPLRRNTNLSLILKRLSDFEKQLGVEEGNSNANTIDDETLPPNI